MKSKKIVFLILILVICILVSLIIIYSMLNKNNNNVRAEEKGTPLKNKISTAEIIEKEVVYDDFFNASAGDEIGIISIPTLKIKDETLYYSATREVLSKGICMDSHDGGWQWIGEKGRSIIASHNNSFFNKLENIEKGDIIYIDMGYAAYEFEVVIIDIYKPKDNDWLEKAYLGTEEYGIVLETCYPLDRRNTTGEKYLVKCNLIKGVKYINKT